MARLCFVASVDPEGSSTEDTLENENEVSRSKSFDHIITFYISDTE